MTETWVILVPPVLVLLCASITRRVVLSLSLGIFSAGLIAYDFNINASLLGIVKRLVIEAVSIDHLYTFGFLSILGMLIQLMTQTGGVNAYTHFIRTYLQDARSTQLASLLLSTTFFIDDYLNSLTVGSIMRPLIDYFKVPRVKFAFLLAAMSAPLCVIIPATSWIAMIIAQLQVSGISQQGSDYNPVIIEDPFNVYLHMLPYFFYPFFIIMAAFFIVYFRLSFGPMHTYEDSIAHDNKTTVIDKTIQGKGGIADFFIPLGIFMGSLGGLLLFSGSFYWFGGKNTLVLALQNAQGIWAIFWAASIALVISFPLFLLHNKIACSILPTIISDGFLLMKNSLIILLLAWTLSSLLKNDLHLGEYFAYLLVGSVPFWLLPLMIFITSLLISASTGSAWGTIAVMFPIIIPMLVALGGISLPSMYTVIVLFPSLGAIISGAIAGGHVSPIADSAVIVATGAGVSPLDHIRTQIWYVIPVLIGSCAAFFIAGLASQSPHFLLRVGLPYTIGFLIVIIIFIVAARAFNK